jgi:hypothetical protein
LNASVCCQGPKKVFPNMETVLANHRTLADSPTNIWFYQKSLYLELKLSVLEA